MKKVDVGLLVGLQRQKIKFFQFLCGCWPPRKPPAAKSLVFFFDFYIAFKRFLTCGNDKSGFKSEKLALCVELLPKHSQKRNLVPILYIKLFSNPYLSFF